MVTVHCRLIPKKGSKNSEFSFHLRVENENRKPLIDAVLNPAEVAQIEAELAKTNDVYIRVTKFNNSISDLQRQARAFLESKEVVETIESEAKDD